ncbi:hypothetical protein DMENIID0001_035330 [Sergentomyia squamirostris]
MTDDQRRADLAGNWLTAGPSYKRKTTPPRTGNGEKHSAAKQTKLDEFFKGINTQNRYSPLPVETNDDTAVNNDNKDDTPNSPQTNNEHLNGLSSEKRQSKPPPIFVYNVEQVQPLMALLNEVAPNKYTWKSLGGDQVKIQLRQRGRQQTGNVSGPEPGSSSAYHAAGPTFADMVRTGGIPHHHNEAGADPHTPVAQSSGDMQELKEMMKQLMSQMSSMLNVLTALVPKIKN